MYLVNSPGSIPGGSSPSAAARSRRFLSLASPSARAQDAGIQLAQHPQLDIMSDEPWNIGTARAPVAPPPPEPPPAQPVIESPPDALRFELQGGEPRPGKFVNEGAVAAANTRVAASVERQNRDMDLATTAIAVYGTTIDSVATRPNVGAEVRPSIFVNGGAGDDRGVAVESRGSAGHHRGRPVRQWCRRAGRRAARLRSARDRRGGRDRGYALHAGRRQQRLRRVRRRARAPDAAAGAGARGGEGRRARLHRKPGRARGGRDELRQPDPHAKKHRPDARDLRGLCIRRGQPPGAGPIGRRDHAVRPRHRGLRPGDAGRKSLGRARRDRHGRGRASTAEAFTEQVVWALVGVYHILLNEIAWRWNRASSPVSSRVRTHREKRRIWKPVRVVAHMVELLRNAPGRRCGAPRTSDFGGPNRMAPPALFDG